MPDDSHASCFKNYHVLSRFNFREIQKNSWTNSHGFFKKWKILSVQSRGFSVQSRGFSVQSRGFSVQSRGFSVQSRGFSVQSRGFSVQSRGFSDQKSTRLNSSHGALS